MIRRLQFAEFVIISIIIHSCLVLMTFIDLAKTKIEKPVEIEIALVTPLPPSPVLKQPEIILPLDEQLVQQDKQDKTNDKPDTKFLAAHNVSVKKQTVAKKKEKFNNSKKIQDKEVSRELASNTKGSSSTEDNIKDVDEGLETLLNTREFKFFNYFNLLKRRMTGHWTEQVRMKFSDLKAAGVEVQAESGMITKLSITIGSSGSLDNLIVLIGCGSEELDSAVVSAFKEAAPFERPPEGVLDPSGKVTIVWDFVLD